MKKKWGIIMLKLLGTEELKNILNFEYSKNTVLKNSKMYREFNVKAFNSISRINLQYGKRERRVCLYETLNGEKIYIQYPGKESVGKRQQMPYDFRPEIEMKDGTFISDAAFGDIWDILSEIGNEQKKELPFVASLFLKLGYMHNYKLYNEKYDFYDLDISSGDKIDSGVIGLEWYGLDLSEDVWFTLNDRIGNVKLSDKEIFSFEAFIKFVDLLFQNEDCKYYYKNVIVKGKKKYNFSNGRTQSSAANLLIINHLEENTKLSELLNAFQKSRGVPSFKKQDYTVVTNGMVINIDSSR